ncbi:hypothetical protein R3P38DRAFT_2510527 [Favolaschia claudopus]|uniref:Uncharacterized protein n=1 Tax=Favolaschia claudopus TaxID=2862362 RepID=A0AAW0CWD1_9AGAR
MAKNKKRVRQRVPKENRKNLRLWAEGARETVLAPHLDAYQIALDQGRRQERKLLKKICREFHARVDWRTKDHEEPMLSEWDPAGIATEEDLSEEDEAAKRTRIEELNKASHTRIRRWFMYRLKKSRKNQRLGKELDARKDPYAVLMANLSGVTAPPKALQAYQQFMRESYEEKVAPVVAERWELERNDNSKLSERTKEPKAGFRAVVAREVFAQLSDEERTAIADRAKKEAAEAKAEYLKALKSPPSKSPEARQRCIDNVADFAGPILQGLSANTGLHATLIMGGPMPEFGGEIRTLHVSYGRNHTVLGPHWPQWDKPRFSEVTKFMTEYLHTAYSECQCAQAALNQAPDLSGANYTIDREQSESSDSDSSDSDSSDTDSDSDSEAEEDAEEQRRVRKKRKTKKDSGNSENKAPERQQNIRRNEALLQQLKADVAPDLNAMKASMQNKSSAKSVKRTTKPLTQTTRETRSSAANKVPPVLQEESLPPATSTAHTATQNSVLVPPSALTDEVRVVPDNHPVNAQTVIETASASVPPSLPPNSSPDNQSNAGSVEPVAHDSPSDSPAVPPLSQAAHSALTTITTPSQPTVLPSASSAYPVCPPQAAKWFAEAHASMTKVDLGCHYHALIAAWTRLEVASRFENSPTNLTAKLRPKPVTLWISRNRRTEPIVEDPAEYARQWQSWWDSLQPSWRTKGADDRWIAGNTYGGGGREWGALYHWGVNGMLSVVASLYFWGRAIDSKQEFIITWETAVQDVVWMFEGMAMYYEMFKGKF